MSTLFPNAELLRRKLEGMSVIGPEPDIEAPSDEELGVLSPLVWKSESHDALVLRLRRYLETRPPKFDAASALAAFESLTIRARRARGTVRASRHSEKRHRLPWIVARINA